MNIGIINDGFRVPAFAVILLMAGNGITGAERPCRHSCVGSGTGSDDIFVEPITQATAALSISTSILTPGTVNAAYSQTLTASGGAPPYSNWTVSSGVLPAGLTLSAAGILSGTPSKAGVYGFKAKVTDSAGVSATSASLSLTIAPALAISTASTLPSGTVNLAYTQIFAVTGGTPPYSGWTISSGTPPPGLTLNATGALSGTPTQAGTYSFTVGVSDKSANVASASFQLTIAPGKLGVSTAPQLPAGQVNVVYAQTLAATGGTPPYTAWGVASGSLPPGLTLSSSGLLAGAPTTAGTYSFTVQVTDSANATASTLFHLTISPPALQIATSSPLSGGQVNASYSQTLSAIGGTPPYTKWLNTGGTLPPGLTLSAAGVVSGTPSNTGAYSFVVQVTDKAGATASATYQLTISQGALMISTTSPLAGGRVNAYYTQSLIAIGGRPPYTWAANSGVPGLSFSPAGIWSGTPTTSGTFNFTVQVADGGGATLSAPFQLIISPSTPVSISTTSPLPAGNVNSVYLQGLTANYGTPPYGNWSVTSGTLPAGLALSSVGVLSGIPLNPGTSSFTVQVTDSGGISTSAPLQLTINAAKLSITSASTLPSARLNSSYSQTMAASGGTPPYTWASNSTVAGLTLSPAGIWSGTPSAAGAYSFTVQVTDSAAVVASGLFQLAVTPPALAISTSALAAGRISMPYSQSLVASGGTPPYAWTGTVSAPGLSISSLGILSGTPTAPGSYTLNVQVSDSAAGSATAQIPLTINSAALAIITASPLPVGKLSTVYSSALSASGGTPPYMNWSVTSGSLPPGLVLNPAGVLSGNPTSAGTYTFKVQVADSTAAVASSTFQLTISATALLVATMSPLPGGKVNTAYSQAFTASGGTPPYVSWITVDGTLPPGLTLSSAGLLSGTPTTAGNYVFTIQVTDTANANSSTSFQLTIGSSALTITTLSPLPGGHVGTLYSQVLSATGGTAPYTNWNVVSGTLPPGLALSASGLLSGNPTSTGSFAFSIQVTDKTGAVASTAFQLSITSIPLAISTTSPLPVGRIATAYALSMTASGGIPPYSSWATSDGALPPGLTLNAAGTLSGTPTTTGSFNFNVQVVDSARNSATAAFQLTVNPVSLAIATLSTLPNGQANTTYTQPLVATGGVPPYSNWSMASGLLPAGLTLASNGVLSGTPTTTGTFSFAIQVTDSSGASASASFQLTISQPAPTIVAAVSSASFAGGLPLVSGSWVALYGANLAPPRDSRVWNSTTEIINGKLPVTLDGTSVTVNGKPASIGYISPVQVNIQMPDDPTIGPASIVLTTSAGGVSSAFPVTYAQFSPGFFPATAAYIVAQHADSSYVTTSAPANPGEVIVLWGAGMGPAAPPVPAGQVFSGANPLAYPLTLTIGGQPAALDFAGVVGAGLVQINAHVPTGIGAGDQAVVATVGGVSSPAGAYIRIGAASSPGVTDIPNAFSTNPGTVPNAMVLATPVYAGTDNGVYRSTDGGESWQQCLSSPGTAINSMVVDRRNPERVWAAGVNRSGGDTFFSSLDGGETWWHDSAPPVQALAIDAIAPDVIYLLDTRGTVLRSDDSGRTWLPTSLANTAAIAADSRVMGRVFAVTKEGRLLVSYDFGLIWTPIPNQPVLEIYAAGIIGISAAEIDAQNDGGLYVISSAAGCNYRSEFTLCGVFRSDDGGFSWMDLSGVDPLRPDLKRPPFVVLVTGNSEGRENTLPASLFSDSRKAGHIYVLTKVAGEANGPDELLRSVDYGANWVIAPIAGGRLKILSFAMAAR